MGDYVLSVKDWSVSFGKFNVIKKLNLKIGKSEIYGIIGVSGVGKTTLLTSLTTVIKPDSGSLFFDFGKGLENVSGKEELYKSRIGFSSQEGSFYPELSVEENLSYFASLYSIPSIEKRISEVLRLVELSKFKDVKASKLSGGMQKRLDIGCAIIHKPKLLLLDEPTADLDPMMRSRIWEVVKRINKQGTSILVASHFLDELEAVCHKLGVLHNKHLIVVGSVSQLRHAYSNDHEIHVTLKGSYDALINHLKSMGYLSMKKIRLVNGELVLITPNLKDTLREIVNFADSGGTQLVSVNVKDPSVKEIFESLIKSGFDF